MVVFCKNIRNQKEREAYTVIGRQIYLEFDSKYVPSFISFFWWNWIEAYPELEFLKSLWGLGTEEE
jgi:hypothetical protein